MNFHHNITINWSEPEQPISREFSLEGKEAALLFDMLPFLLMQQRGQSVEDPDFNRFEFVIFTKKEYVIFIESEILTWPCGFEFFYKRRRS
jgi:hypothetical protein